MCLRTIPQGAVREALSWKSRAPVRSQKLRRPSYPRVMRKNLMNQKTLRAPVTAPRREKRAAAIWRCGGERGLSG